MFMCGQYTLLTWIYGAHLESVGGYMHWFVKITIIIKFFYADTSKNLFKRGVFGCFKNCNCSGAHILVTVFYNKHIQ